MIWQGRCLREMKMRSREGKTGSGWGKERRCYFEDSEVGLELLERRRECGEDWGGGLGEKR